ncbi:MAG: hypothetical protein O3C21_13655 [Verrucomicrobia bacterium]|nr:hypothetical protein [Verrucomicrobiota bacterium]
MDTPSPPKNITANTDTKSSVSQLEARLAKHPNLIPLVARMLDVADDSLDGAPDAHQVEDQTVELMRELGNEVLCAWSQTTHDRAKEEACRLNPNLIIHRRKYFVWYGRFGLVSLIEIELQDGRRGQKLWRPFLERARICCRGLALGVQRAAIDFTSDHPFGKASAKLMTHYGFDLDPSRLRNLSLQHGKACADYMLPAEPPQTQKPEQLVAELDGTMIPLITTGKADTDKSGTAQKADARKNRNLHWGEARLSVVYVPGQTSAVHGALLGDRFEAGLLWQQTAKAAGYTSGQVKVHGVGDGARWIKEEFDTAFGSDGNYLIDYYHVGEYLSDAAPGCNPQSPDQWIKEQKGNLLEGRQERVIEELKAHRSPVPLTGEAKSPVDRAHDYLEARVLQLDYASARAADLPIGSGAVGGKHRSVIHERLKIPGAWWLRNNARAMLNLRTMRANEGCWDAYWASLN